MAMGQHGFGGSVRMSLSLHHDGDHDDCRTGSTNNDTDLRNDVVGSSDAARETRSTCSTDTHRPDMSPNGRMLRASVVEVVR